MSINERTIQIRADKISTTSELENGQDVLLYVRGSVKSILHKDNDDGTEDLVYIIKGIFTESAEEILNID